MDTTELLVRPAISADVEPVATLAVEHFGHLYNAVFGTGPTDTRRILAELMRVRDGAYTLGYRTVRVLATQSENEVVGYCRVLTQGTFPLRKQAIGIAEATALVLRRVRPDLPDIPERLRVLRDAMHTADAEELVVVQIAVEATERGRGGATLLLREACDEAKRLGRKRVMLEVRAKNRARDVFEHLGFIQKETLTAPSDRRFGRGPLIRYELELPR